MRGPNTGPHDWNAVIDGAQPLAENYAYVRTYKTMHRRSVYYVERTCVLHRNNKTKTIILLLVFGSIIRKSITSSVPLGSYIKQGRSESIFCFPSSIDNQEFHIAEWTVFVMLTCFFSDALPDRQHSGTHGRIMPSLSAPLSSPALWTALCMPIAAPA